MQLDADAGCGDRSGRSGSDEAAGRERGVEGGQDGAIGDPFERDALGVDCDVDRAEPGAEAEERGREPDEVGREGGGERASRRRAGALRP